MNGTRWVRNALEKEVDRTFAHGGSRWADRRQCGCEELGHLVVVCHDGKVVRNGDSAIERKVDKGHGLGIRVHEKRGVGTSSYSFIWAMASENQAFDDMDAAAVTTLR
jgi:hypothetical protein